MTTYQFRLRATT